MPDLDEMRYQLETLSEVKREPLLVLWDRVSHYVNLQNRLVRVAQETVDQLQLEIKYLQFDLEVTQRERDILRQDLDSDQSGW